MGGRSWELNSRRFKTSDEFTHVRHPNRNVFVYWDQADTQSILKSVHTLHGSILQILKCRNMRIFASPSKQRKEYVLAPSSGPSRLAVSPTALDAWSKASNSILSWKGFLPVSLKHELQCHLLRSIRYHEAYKRGKEMDAL